MLVLTRKTDESIIIDGRIKIKLLQMKGNRIRLGIEAPEDVSIRRSELPPRVADNDSLDGDAFDGNSLDMESDQATCDEIMGNEILSHCVA